MKRASLFPGSTFQDWPKPASSNRTFILSLVLRKAPLLSVKQLSPQIVYTHFVIYLERGTDREAANRALRESPDRKVRFTRKSRVFFFILSLWFSPKLTTPTEHCTVSFSSGLVSIAHSPVSRHSFVFFSHFRYDLEGASSKLMMLDSGAEPVGDAVLLWDIEDDGIGPEEEEGGSRGWVWVRTSSSSSSSSSSMLGHADWSSTRFRRSFNAFRASCLKGKRKIKCILWKNLKCLLNKNTFVAEKRISAQKVQYRFKNFRISRIIGLWCK